MFASIAVGISTSDRLSRALFVEAQIDPANKAAKLNDPNALETIMHKTVDDVRYAIGGLHSGGGSELQVKNVYRNTNLDVSLDGSYNLNLMLRYNLCEGDKEYNLGCYLIMVLHFEA
jgi:hypothetical protein